MIFNLSYEELVARTRIGNIEEDGFPKEWLLGQLRFLLLPDNEYDALPPEDDACRFKSILFDYHIDRIEVIPLFCSELIRFEMGEND